MQGYLYSGGVIMKKIYILLSRTGTLPSRLIHLSLGGAFTHASIALTPETDKLFSFARRTLHNPLNAGFILEDTQTFVFAKHPEGICAVYALDVSEDAYKNMEKILCSFILEKHRYGYNFLGAIPSKLGIKWSRKYHFTCSQFVAFVLYASNAAKLPKHYSLMMPNDFLDIENITQIYSGKIGECKIKTKNTTSSVENNK